MIKLEKLTPEQAALMSVVKDEWLNRIFKCNKEINSEECENGIEFIYSLAKLNKPKIIYFSSPMAAQFACYYLGLFLSEIDKRIKSNTLSDSVGDSVQDSVQDSVHNSVGDSVWDSVRNSVGASVHNSVRNSVWNSVWNSVGDSVWDSVRNSVGASVWASVRNSVGASVRASVWDSVGNSVGDSVGDSVRDSVWDSVHNSVRDSVWDSVHNSVQDSVHNSVGNSVWASVWDSVGNSVRASVGDSVRDSVWDSVHNSVQDSVHNSVGNSVQASKMKFESFAGYGNIGDYGWVAFYDYFTRIGILDNKDFNSFKSLIGSGIYDMIQLKGFCIVCELPNKITRDELGRLHNTTESAISWKDGYEQYYIHGRAVKKELFDLCLSGKVTKNDFIKQGNEENKAAIYEILGQEKIIQLLEAKEVDRGTFVHACGDLEEVVLYKTVENFPELDNQPLAWVRFICPSTGTNYLIDVEPHHTDARKAAVSTSPIIESVEEYSWDERA